MSTSEVLREIKRTKEALYMCDLRDTDTPTLAHYLRQAQSIADEIRRELTNRNEGL